VVRHIQGFLVEAGALAPTFHGASNIDSVRLGALAVKTGAAGTLYFDEFESRRQGFIGDLVIAP
jgi:hypothetical protein